MVNVPFWAAILMNVAGNVAASLGTNVIKLGHNKLAAMDMPKEDKPPVWKMPEWIIGFAVFLTGNIVTNVSFVFAAQSVLAALGSVQLVFNVIFCYYILHEPVTLTIILTTGCIISGCILLVIFGNHSSETFTVPELLDLYTKTPYIVYLVCLVLVSFGTYIIFCHGRQIAKRTRLESEALKTVVSLSALDTVWVTIAPLAYSIYSAFIGTQSVVFSKSLTTMLFDGHSWGYWYLYVDLILFIGTAVFWLRQLNGGIHMFPAMVIVPVLQIMWIFFSILSGLIYFQEYATYDALSYGMFFTGVVIMFAGIYMLLHVAGLQREGYTPMADDADVKIDNAAFEAQPGDEHQVSQLGMTGMSTLRRGQPSLTRLGSRRSWMGATDLAASIRSRMSESMLEKEEQHGNESLMGTLTRKVQNGPKAAVRTMMGLDAGMAAISIFNFTMPADDLYSSKRHHRNTLNATDKSQGGSTNAPSGGGGAPVLHHSAIEEALPQSRFPNVAAHRMPAIVEMEESRPSSFGLAKRRLTEEQGDERSDDAGNYSANARDTHNNSSSHDNYNNDNRSGHGRPDENRSTPSGGAPLRPGSALASRPGSGNDPRGDVDGSSNNANHYHNGGGANGNVLYGGVSGRPASGNEGGGGIGRSGSGNGGGSARPGSAGGGGTAAGRQDNRRDGGGDEGSPTHMRGRPRPPSIEISGIEDPALSAGGTGGTAAITYLGDQQQQRRDGLDGGGRRDEPAGRGWQAPTTTTAVSQQVSRAGSGLDAGIPPGAGGGGAFARTSRPAGGSRMAASTAAQLDAELAYRVRESVLQHVATQQQLAEQQQQLMLQQQQQAAAAAAYQQQRSYGAAAAPPQYDGVDQYSTPVSSAVRASYELLLQRQQQQQQGVASSRYVQPAASSAYGRPPPSALRPAGVTWAQTSYETPLLTRTSSNMDPQGDVPRGRAGTVPTSSYTDLYLRPQQYNGSTDGMYGGVPGPDVRRSTLFPAVHETVGFNARTASGSVHSSASLSPGTLTALQQMQRPSNSRLALYGNR